MNFEPSAQFALPELHDLKLFSSRAFANEACAAAVRASRRLFDGVWNAMGVCKRGGHTRDDGCTLPRPRYVTDFGRFDGAAWLG